MYWFLGGVVMMNENKLLEKITLDIEMVNNYDEVLKDALNDVVKEHESLVSKAKALSDYRRSVALKIEKGIIKECKENDPHQ